MFSRNACVKRTPWKKKNMSLDCSSIVTIIKINCVIIGLVISSYQ